MLNTTLTEAVNSIHNTQNITREHDLLYESVTFFSGYTYRSMQLLFQQQCCHTVGQAKEKLPVVSPSNSQSTLSNSKQPETRGQEVLVGQFFGFSFCPGVRFIVSRLHSVAFRQQTLMAHNFWNIYDMMFMLTEWWTQQKQCQTHPMTHDKTYMSKHIQYS